VRVRDERLFAAFSLFILAIGLVFLAADAARLDPTLAPA